MAVQLKQVTPDLSPKRQTYNLVKINPSDEAQMNAFGNATGTMIYGAQVRRTANSLGYSDIFVKPTDPVALGAIEDINARTSRSMRLTYNEYLGNALNKLPDGQTVEQYMRQLQPFMDATRAYNETVLFPYLAAQIRQEAYSQFFDQNGIQAQYKISPEDTTSPDDEICAIDIAKGEVDDPSEFEADEYPAHQNCFPAGTLVAGPLTHQSFARPYKGPVVTIRTARGNELAGTPNHPVLTPKGWVALGSLAEGDDVLSCLDMREMSLVVGSGVGLDDPNKNQVPSRIEDVLSASAMPLLKVPSSAQDFHGDGMPDSYVDVVRADGLLRGQVFPAQLRQHLDKDLLAASHGSDSLPSSGSLRQLAHGGSAAPSSLVRGSHDGPTLAGGHGGHALDIPLAVQLAFLWPVHADELRLMATTDACASSSQGSLQGSGRGTDFLRKRERRLSRLIALDQVIDVRENQFSDHVFNLSTAWGWYAANGIIVSNCPHFIIRVNVQPDSLPSENDLWRGDMGSDIAAKHLRGFKLLRFFTKEHDVSDEARDDRGRWTDGGGDALATTRSAVEKAEIALSEHARSSENLTYAQWMDSATNNKYQSERARLQAARETAWHDYRMVQSPMASMPVEDHPIPSTLPGTVMPDAKFEGRLEKCMDNFTNQGLKEALPKDGEPERLFIRGVGDTATADWQKDPMALQPTESAKITGTTAQDPMELAIRGALDGGPGNVEAQLRDVAWQRVADQSDITPKSCATITEGWNHSPSSPEGQALEQQVGHDAGLPLDGRTNSTDPSKIDADVGKFAQGQYSVTQSWYDEHPDQTVQIDGKSYVPLTRGVYFDEGKVPSGWDQIQPGESATATLHLDPLSSWTNDPSTAENFARTGSWGVKPVENRGFTVSAYMPVERVFSNGLTGVGVAREGEHLVMDGGVQVKVTRIR